MARAPRNASGVRRRGLAAQLTREWRAGPIHKLAIAAPRPRGLAAKPRDPRPADAERGARLLAGEFRLAGQGFDVGPAGDPWDRPCPSEAFAIALHGLGWSRDLLAAGEAGAQETLRLWRGWRRLFGRTGAYGWTGLALERRVFNLACAAPALLPLATERENAFLLGDLARQARHLLGDPADPGRGLERLAVAALAGAALAGPAGEALLRKTLPRLERLAPRVVLPDGVHASRSPERGLELLFDLAALDDVLSHRGAPAPAETARALDRLAGAVRFFASPGPRLPRFQGGEAGDRAGLAMVLALESAAPASGAAPYGGYQRLDGRRMTLIADAGPSDQPLAMEIAVDGQPLALGSAWSTASPPTATELAGPLGGSTLGLGETRPEPGAVEVERREEGEALWLDLSHLGWRRAFGAVHTRRLYLDRSADELRGEDVLARSGGRRRGVVPYAIRFQLAPGVEAELAPGARTAALRLPGGEVWRLQSDAASLNLAGGTIYEGGRAHPAQVIVLAGEAAPDGETRIRWKLSPEAPAA